MKKYLLCLCLLLLLSVRIVAQQNVGSATLVVGPTSSLLAGMTPANFTLPAGWTLLTTQDFEGALPLNQTLVFSASISTVRAHGGTHSLQEVISATSGASLSNPQSPGGWWSYTPGLTSGTDYYLSWWSYLDPNALADSDGFFGRVDVASPQQELLMNIQVYGGKLSTNPNLWFAPNSNAPNAVECSQFLDSPNPQNCSFVGRTWTLNLGTWEQEELWIHPSTCTGGVPNNDGFARFFVNGALLEQVDKNFATTWNGGNINGCVNMFNNPTISIPGVWTYLYNNNPTTFNKYVDDIIVMKK